MLKLKSRPCRPLPVALEEKARYGTVAAAGANVAMNVLGLHLDPLAEIAGGAGL